MLFVPYSTNTQIALLGMLNQSYSVLFLLKFIENHYRERTVGE